MGLAVAAALVPAKTTASPIPFACREAHRVRTGLHQMAWPPNLSRRSSCRPNRRHRTDGRRALRCSLSQVRHRTYRRDQTSIHMSYGKVENATLSTTAFPAFPQLLLTANWTGSTRTQLEGTTWTFRVGPPRSDSVLSPQS